MLSNLSLKNLNFDCLAVGVLDFKKSSFKTSEISPNLFFDLASLTKPLTLSSVKFARPQLWEKDFDLLLNHKAGLPDWGRLSRANWREELMDFPIKKSPTLYSDFGALRLMLELEKKSGKSLKELASFYWDKDLVFWKDLKNMAPITGMRKGHPITGQVHDDNAYIIGSFCSHAGLFGSIEGVCKSLISLNDKTSFVKKVSESFSGERFVEGWDTPGADSLAGVGHSPKTFGHLGFTGTSIWIDGEKEIGHVILTNATKKYWYDRTGLNNLRRALGEKLWKWI
jgi:CubicO group peptidase (beta-lactamase class C family)